MTSSFSVLLELHIHMCADLNARFMFDRNLTSLLCQSAFIERVHFFLSSPELVTLVFLYWSFYQVLLAVNVFHVSSPEKSRIPCII